MTEEHKYSKLTKSGWIVYNLKNKYKDAEKNKVPRLREPYRRPFDVDRDHHTSYPICEECEGRVINPGGGSWTCEDCGLVQEQIYGEGFKGGSKGRDDYKDTTESPGRKDRRTYIQDKLVHKKMRPVIKKQTEILTDVKKKLQKYCKKHQLIQWMFVSEVILEAILPETLDEENG